MSEETHYSRHNGVSMRFLSEDVDPGKDPDPAATVCPIDSMIFPSGELRAQIKAIGGRFVESPYAYAHSLRLRAVLFSSKRSEKNTVKILDSMLERNKDFADQQSAAGTLMPSLPRALPNVKAIIVGCADMRVDPAHVLGIKPGEAVVVRNIGGRITPDLLQQLGLLGRIGRVAGETPGGGGEFHLIVLQHTDCGITRLAGDAAVLANYFGIPETELKAKSVSDPRTAVAVDVAALRAVPALPGNWMISGLLYDVATGLVEVVLPPAPIRIS